MKRSQRRQGGQVAIGYVFMQDVAEKFMRSCFNAIVEDQNRFLSGHLIGCSPANIAEARCTVTQQFLDSTDADWLWFIDTDIIFPPDTHVQLLRCAHKTERPIVSAAYWTHYGDGTHLCWQVLQDGQLHPVLEAPDEPVQLASVGFGCVLIHRGVLEKMRTDYEKDPWPWFGNDPVITSAGPKRIGEDMTFCFRAIKSGFSVWGAPVPVKHRKTTILEQPVRERELVA